MSFTNATILQPLPSVNGRSSAEGTEARGRVIRSPETLPFDVSVAAGGRSILYLGSCIAPNRTNHGSRRTAAGDRANALGSLAVVERRSGTHFTHKKLIVPRLHSFDLRRPNEITSFAFRRSTTYASTSSSSFYKTMCQASSTVRYSSSSSSKKSSAATAAASLRKPVTPSASFRLSMRRDRDNAHTLSSSSLPAKLSLRRRLQCTDGCQHVQTAWRAIVDIEPSTDSAATPTTTSTAKANSVVVAPVLLTPRTPDVVPAGSLDQDMSLRWLSPPLLEPSSDEDEYRSISSLPDAILIPDF
jgi:hypothetical protein